MLTGRRILVTGGTGYLGSWLAERARQAGHDVRLLVRRVPEHMAGWAAGYDVVEADITRSDLADAFRGRDLVWHSASLNETRTEGDIEAAIATNVAGTSHTLQAAVDAQVPIFVKFSTFHVYGHSGGGTLEEAAVARPKSVYGLTQLLGDETALYFRRAHGINVRIPRVSNGYGAPLNAGVDRWSLVVNDLVRMAYESGEIVLRSSGLQHRDFVSLADVYDATCRLSTPGLEHTIFHVGEGRSRSILEVARLAQQVCEQRLKRKIPIRTGPGGAQAEDPVRYDISRLRALGFAPTDAMTDEMGRILDVLENR